MTDLLSYFRRAPAKAKRKPVAEDPIDLESMGGEISNTYLDIASVGAPVEKPRPKTREVKQPREAQQPREVQQPREIPPPREPPPQREAPPPQASAQSPAPPPAVAQQPPASPPQRAFAPPPSPTPPPGTAARPQQRPPTSTVNGQRPAPRPRRRTDANGAPPSDRSGLLAVHGVEKSFVGRKVVKGVSFYVRKGEAVGLLGPNGAGKTTVFYMVTGLIKADEGRIELDGHDVTKLPMYQRARLGIGYLPQEASIFRGLTVEDNIRSVLEVVEPDKKRRARDLDALLEEFNIARLRKTPSIALSGGERRRCEIARALATRPNYMLLDEPFAGIDPIAVGDIQSLVRHLTNRGIGVLITDHNVRETLGLTDRAYIIYSGEVLMEGRADEIVSNPDVRRLYLGEEFKL
ncbi:MAG TPA: LPS export ABC transporter ATP-binding protein [Xanthobacteraceae bacterium]|nr:LPS export ABC transporter ATP-binding protein [Xanthobacteraceae bacterium]